MRRVRLALLGLVLLAGGSVSGCFYRAQSTSGQPRYCDPSMCDYETELTMPESTEYLARDLH
jgi:hypothetical protein